MSGKTGLTIKQVNNWLCNQRRKQDGRGNEKDRKRRLIMREEQLRKGISRSSVFSQSQLKLFEQYHFKAELAEIGGSSFKIPYGDLVVQTGQDRKKIRDWFSKRKSKDRKFAETMKNTLVENEVNVPFETNTGPNLETVELSEHTDVSTSQTPHPEQNAVPIHSDTVTSDPTPPVRYLSDNLRQFTVGDLLGSASSKIRPFNIDFVRRCLFEIVMLRPEPEMPAYWVSPRSTLFKLWTPETSRVYNQQESQCSILKKPTSLFSSSADQYHVRPALPTHAPTKPPDMVGTPPKLI
ncbi:Protein CBG10990 [Caenorhabditis briggsae]|uniref:Protein CBG10990 n=1 Tax=Caenorhabditis briggsae TaxID=6238 RepID=A8XC01_CAEBR|nr:Protein CBG10990 [Caenorhabditis briggsae]CAP30240.2 Protein CBG10990 [Caenorhabditis briggsae]